MVFIVKIFIPLTLVSYVNSVAGGVLSVQESQLRDYELNIKLWTDENGGIVKSSLLFICRVLLRRIGTKLRNIIFHDKSKKC